MKPFRFFISIYFVFITVISASEWEKITTDNGLVDNLIWKISEDAHGYLWFVTFLNGVSRFDSRRFYNFHNLNELPSNNIYNTFPDKSGNFWVSTDRGISFFDGVRFNTLVTKRESPLENINLILEDNGNSLWFAGSDGISFYKNNSHLDPSVEKFGFVENTNEIGEIIDFKQDRNGNLWIASETGLFSYNQTTQLKLFESFSNFSLQCLSVDQSNNLWIGTSKGLFFKPDSGYVIDGPVINDDIAQIYEDRNYNIWVTANTRGIYFKNIDNLVFEKRLENYQITSMSEDLFQKTWIGTTNGVGYFDEGKYSHVSEIDNIPIGLVNDVLTDKDGIVWIATNDGVFKHTPNHIKFFFNEESINEFFVDKNGGYWIGTDNGLLKFDGKRFIHQSLSGSEKIAVLSITEDSAGDIWIGTSRGVYRNFNKVFKNIPEMNTAIREIIVDRVGRVWFATSMGISCAHNDSLQSYPIENGGQIFADSKGALWVGTLDNGLYKIENNTNPTNYSISNGLISNHVTWIIESNDRKLWCGLKGELIPDAQGNISKGGIALFDGEAFVSFSSSDGLPEQSVLSGINDKSGNLWLASNQGLIKFSLIINQQYNIEKFSINAGLISDYISSLAMDRLGNIWIGTDKGVSKFDGDNFQNINLEEFIGLDEINQIYPDQNGQIWFITQKSGVFNYQPPNSNIRPRVLITSVIADSIYTGNAKLRIPATTDRISFEFLGISYSTKPDKIGYTYYLTDIDSVWHPFTLDNRVIYNCPPPGKYKFQVKAVDKNLHYSDPPAMVEMEIYLPFNKSFLYQVIFGFLSIILIGGIGYLTNKLNHQRQITAKYKERLKRQKEAERIQAAKMESLRQLVAGVAHEVNNPIGAIRSSHDVMNRAIEKIKTTLLAKVPELLSEEPILSRAFMSLEKLTVANNTATSRIANIVSNLKSFARLDEAEWQMTNILKDLDSTIALMETETGERILFRKLYGDIPEIYCSPRNLNQVFRCLLKNACEAIIENGIIEILTTQIESNIRVEIKDNGKGIAPENLARVFDPGFTTKGSGVGVGLGLSICYKIVTDDHHGHIFAESEVNKGSRFVILLPIRKEPDDKL